MQELEMFLRALAHVLGKKESFFQFYTTTTINPKFPVFKTCKLTLMCVEGGHKHCISDIIHKNINTSEKSVDEVYKEIQQLTIENLLKYYNVT